VNPLDELGDFVNERREEILKRCADLGRKYNERIQAHRNWIVEKQTYLNRQAPPHEWVDGKLTIRPGWVPPSQAWLDAQNERIKSHEKLFDAAKAAETAAESALEQAHSTCAIFRQIGHPNWDRFPLTTQSCLTPMNAVSRPSRPRWISKTSIAVQFGAYHPSGCRVDRRRHAANARAVDRPLTVLPDSWPKRNTSRRLGTTAVQFQSANPLVKQPSATC
jgi:hypothetical protein